jgi:hypothetical protein
VPEIVPPATVPGTPGRHLLPAGSRLWRVHHRYRDAVQFDPPTAGLFGGGRFDATAGGSGQLYAAAEQSTALAERFLPGLGFDSDGLRFLPRKALDNHTLSVVTTKRDSTLLRLTGPEDFAAIGQDDRVVSAPPQRYSRTRECAARIRRVFPWAQGILWRSAVDHSRETLVLFEPDGDAGVLEAVPSHSYPLGGVACESWLVELLGGYGVSTDPPVRERPRVFVNYRSTDGADAARMLTNGLARKIGERRVFRDVQSIAPGAPFAEELLDKARGADVLLVVVGRDWEYHRGPAGRAIEDPEDWVRKEIVAATEAGVALVPVLVGARPRLRESSLPPAVRHLAKVEFCHLPNGYGDSQVDDVVRYLLKWFPQLED